MYGRGDRPSVHMLLPGEAVKCPHGQGPPTSCSQCQGAKPRIVTHDPNTGIVVDGVPAGRPWFAEHRPGQIQWRKKR